MDYQLFVYLMWFFTLYLFPALVFLRGLRVAPELLGLDGVIFTTKYDGQEKVFAIDNNFDEFLEKHTKLSKTIAAKILNLMCNDARLGIKKRPEWYLLKYRNVIKNVIGYIVIGSFVPFIIVSIVEEIPPQELFIPQIICVLFVFVLYKILFQHYEMFSLVFYQNWYDKILNFDLIAINEIKPHILKEFASKNDDALSRAVQALMQNDKALADALLESSNKMAEKLAEFTELQNNSITPDSVMKLLDDNLQNVSALNIDIKEICDRMGSSMSSLLRIAKSKKADINAINGNTAALLELKELFASYKNKTQAAEIEQLQIISDHLKHTISGSFEGIEQAAKDNAEKLAAAYNGFFETCNRFTALLENSHDEKTAAALQSLTDSLKQLNEIFDTRNKELKTGDKL